jgi:crotonobetainyl-CoA:carnitine CoA-transferase CaiB-like acyl-CoA transferase
VGTSHVSRSEAVRACAAILVQIEAEACLAEAPPILVRDATGGSNAARAGLSRITEAAGPSQDRAVEVRIRSGEVAGCRADVSAALVGAHAALAGLAGAAWGKCGGVVAEMDAVDVIATCQGDNLVRLTCPRGVGAGRTEAGDHRPPDVVRCRDGWVGVHAPTSEDQGLLRALAEGEALRTWVGRRRRAEVVETGQLWRLPVVPVLESHEVEAGQPFRFDWTGHRRADVKGGALPLDGVRALDLGMVWAGPYCGRLLAGLGAQVIKVEGPHRRDGTRRVEADGQACEGAFADLNRGKSSLVVDLARPEGREVLLRLARRADVLIENFSPRVMPNFGLGYDVLAEVNPRLVMLSMPAFADDGGVAYGSGLELAAGLVGWDADGRPLPSEIAYLDYLAGCYGAMGVLAALLRGEGAHVTVAQREVAAQALALGGRQRHSEAGMRVNLRALAERAWRSGVLDKKPEACRHYTRLPFRLTDLDDTGPMDAPRFGGDTREILSHDAGLSNAEIEALFASGVVQ